jgi:hypothetical protein
MKTEGKVGLALAAILAAILALTKLAKPATAQGPSAQTYATIASIILEGSTDNGVEVGIVNTSTRGAQQVPFTFNFEVIVSCGAITLLDWTVNGLSLAAGESRTFGPLIIPRFSVPMGLTGAGKGVAIAYDPATGQAVASAETNFTIVAAVIVPSATITW